jgi:hypothetical protein
VANAIPFFSVTHLFVCWLCTPSCHYNMLPCIASTSFYCGCILSAALPPVLFLDHTLCLRHSWTSTCPRMSTHPVSSRMNYRLERLDFSFNVVYFTCFASHACQGPVVRYTTATGGGCSQRGLTRSGAVRRVCGVSLSSSRHSAIKRMRYTVGVGSISKIANNPLKWTGLLTM